MKDEYWVIDLEQEGLSVGDKSARGPFPTENAAAIHIQTETRGLYKESCRCLRNGEWETSFRIVKTVRAVRPSITETVRVTLKDERGGE